MVEKIETIIRGWVAEHVHNSPIAQHTPAYNHLTESLEHLKAALVDGLTPAKPAAKKKEQ